MASATPPAFMAPSASGTKNTPMPQMLKPRREGTNKESHPWGGRKERIWKDDTGCKPQSVVMWKKHDFRKFRSQNVWCDDLQNEGFKQQRQKWWTDKQSGFS